MPVSRRPLVALLPAMALLAACATEPPKRAAVIFFAPDSAVLAPDTGDTIAVAAEAARRFGGEPVQVIGFADPEGTPAANRELSAQRAEAVAAALIGRGVLPSRIRRSARGATEPSLAMVESRRVEIRIGE